MLTKLEGHQGFCSLDVLERITDPQLMSFCLAPISLIVFLPFEAARIQALCFANRPVILLLNLSSRKRITRKHAHLNLRAIIPKQQTQAPPSWLLDHDTLETNICDLLNHVAFLFFRPHALFEMLLFFLSRCRWSHMMCVNFSLYFSVLVTLYMWLL